MSLFYFVVRCSMCFISFHACVMLFYDLDVWCTLRLFPLWCILVYCPGNKYCKLYRDHFMRCLYSGIDDTATLSTRYFFFSLKRAHTVAIASPILYYTVCFTETLTSLPLMYRGYIYIYILYFNLRISLQDNFLFCLTIFGKLGFRFQKLSLLRLLMCVVDMALDSA